MASEIVIDCATGEATVQPDTFLATKPKPEPEPVATNPNQPLIDAITADPATIDPNIMAVALITALGGMPSETITSAASTSATMATISLAQPAPASPATG